MSDKTWLQRNKAPVAIVVVLFFLVALPILWNYTIAPTVTEQNADQGQEIADDTIDAEKALQDYREFRSKWYSIQEQHAQTQNYKDSEKQFHKTYGDDPSEWSRTAETRHGRIHSRIIGSQNQEEMLIAEYNAMQSDATTAIYQCGLPSRVDKKLFITDGTGVSYTSQEAQDKTPPKDPSECKFAQNPEEATQ